MNPPETPPSTHPRQPASSQPAGTLPSPEQLLEALDPDQRQVAEHLEGPMCVLAGAGTGKTRAITYRIAYGVATGAYRPGQVLAVTFTQRAAAEMRSRLALLGVARAQALTFHSAALRQLDYFYPTAVGGRRPPVQEHKAGLVGTAARRLGLSADRSLVRDLAGEVEWAKVTMTLPEDYVRAARAAGREAPGGVELEKVATLYSLYEELKSEADVIDFEDVLLAMTGILRSRPDVAQEVRRHYKHFVVDEYQDVSPLQHELLRLWLGERRSQLCVVGDVSQTIYSFTGARADYLTGFTAEYPSARTVRLVRDYRSTPQVVSLANRVLAGGVRGGRRRGGRMELPPGAVELVAQRPNGPAVRFEDYADDAAEADGVVSHVQRLAAQGVALSQIAVLYRTAAQAPVIEEALARAGIGRVVRGGTRFFERPEVRTAMQRLRGAGATERAHLTGDLSADVRTVLARVGWSPQPPAPQGAVRERWDSLQAIVELADDLAATRGFRLADFVRELADRAQALNAPTVEGVTLSTIHAAKGLEWDAVIMVGVSDGLLPISLAEGPAAIEEERRLLYVGVTRAREHLVLTYAAARKPGARASRRASRFLTGIWPTREDASAGGQAARLVSPPTSPAQARKQAAAEFEREADAATLALFEALRQWRRQVAHDRSVPPYTVFPDATLRLIALIKPTTRPQLALVHGVGPVKLSEYGEALLSFIHQHTSQA